MDLNCILFDLDGTLLNTNKLVIETFKHTIRKHLGQEVSEEQLRPYFGVPLVDIMKAFDPDQVEIMIHTYRSFNLKKHDDLTTLFPDVRPTLEELSNQGIRMGVVTSKIRSMAQRGLDLFSLAQHFEVIVAFEDTDKHKPNPAPIDKAIELIYPTKPIPRHKILMVGDSPFDIQCAANAGVKSAAVDWSIHGGEELKKFNPDFVVTNFLELLDITKK